MKKVLFIILTMLLSGCSVNGVFATAERPGLRHSEKGIEKLVKLYKEGKYTKLIEISRYNTNAEICELRGKCYLMLNQPELAYKEFAEAKVMLVREGLEKPSERFDQLLACLELYAPSENLTFAGDKK